MFDGREAIRKAALNVARYSGLAPLAGPLVGGIGAILMIHRVTARPDKPNSVNRHLTICPTFLDALILDIKRQGFVFVGIDEAIERIGRGRGGQRFVTLTADDGYRDNLTEALPVLERHGVPLTVYVSPALINGTAELWWEVVEDVVEARDILYLGTRNGTVVLDCKTPAAKFAAIGRLHEHLTVELREDEQRAALQKLASSAGIDMEKGRQSVLMNWQELRRMAAHPLVTIGAHTVNHFNLKRLDEAAARREIADVAAILRLETGTTPRHLAYPYGYADAVGKREVRLAREAGYLSAVTTRHGVLRPEHVRHLHALPRLSVNGRYQSLAHVRTMLSGITTPLANRGRRVVTV